MGNKDQSESELKSFEFLSIGSYCDNFKFYNVSDVVKSVVNPENKSIVNCICDTNIKNENSKEITFETNVYIDRISQKILDKDMIVMKLMTLKNIQKNNVLCKFTVCMLNKEPIISAMNKKINKEKIGGFLKKIEQIRIKNSNFVINENDKEYLKEVKKNIESTKEKIMGQLVNIENNLKDIVNLRNELFSKIKQNKIK